MTGVRGGRAVGRLRAVPAREWPAVVVAAGAATLVEVGLRTMPLPRLSRLLGVPLALEDEDGPALPPPVRPRLSPRDAARVRAVARVMRHWPFGSTCLRWALVIGLRLRRLGPRLHVGVAKQDGEVRAHAWLWIAGASLDPSGNAPGYHRLQPVPTASPATGRR